LLEAKELLSGWNLPLKTQTWQERRVAVIDSWSNLRSEMFCTLLKSHFALLKIQCTVCGCNPAVIRCQECANKHLCSKCDNDIHQLMPFHDRDCVINGHYEAISSNLSLDSTCNNLITVGMYLDIFIILH